MILSRPPILMQRKIKNREAILSILVYVQATKFNFQTATIYICVNSFLYSSLIVSDCKKNSSLKPQIYHIFFMFLCESLNRFHSALYVQICYKSSRQGYPILWNIRWQYANCSVIYGFYGETVVHWKNCIIWKMVIGHYIDTEF